MLHIIIPVCVFIYEKKVTVMVNNSTNIKTNPPATSYLRSLNKKNQITYVDVRVMVSNATFNNISAISWRMKPEYPEKTTDLPQVTDKLWYLQTLLII